MNFVEKVFGTHSDRELKYIYPIVDKIEKMRPTMQAMSDEELKDQSYRVWQCVPAGEAEGFFRGLILFPGVILQLERPSAKGLREG